MNYIWLIWSNEHKAWWSPDHRGYTTARSLAGRYTLEEAIKICKLSNDYIEDRQPPDETMLPDV